jgi:hypothetical protein
VKVLDGHVHVGAWRTPDFSGRATTLAEAGRLYAGLGYTGALVMPTDVGDNVGLLAAVAGAAFPFRFCAWVDPDAPGLPALLAAEAGAVAALKIHPSFVRRRCTDEAFEPYYAWAAAHGTPVLVHCGRWQEMASYRFVVEAAQRHRDVAFILCHMGGDGTDLVAATVALLRATGVDNCWLGTESIRQYWVVQHAIAQLGAARVIFGSDYNLNHPASFQAVVDALDLSGAERERVFFANLNGLFPAALRLA